MSKSYLNPNMFVLCKSANEDINHLFLTCVVLQENELWERFSSDIGLGFDTQNITALSESFSKLALNQIKGNVISLNTGVAVIWFLWKERNDIIFKNLEKA